MSSKPMGCGGNASASRFLQMQDDFGKENIFDFTYSGCPKISFLKKMTKKI